ncbi:lysine N(6)-hydroxylase/L-ornithine N(5)-oxygenase family protein [Streptantibioticus silvisoli]|uniref:L-lysine N6-monooxygenase MbtG n=1 Tax=Streptantibioticus silvisoli TaxID=2705255 RepID=A0ABT6VXF9_9ACTN|nr:SidA/IucD/PvdA family monooxygenase [Streptantibioticus silvisoli]MDI5963180.1 SidA/IucD/PvdA family monooxygenase [Streptantibioticus silvisoli]
MTATTPPAPGSDEPLDLAGAGVGPFNLSLAALAAPVPGLRTAFYDQAAAFRWHPGILIDGATLQVPFLADLVTLVDPTSPWSFLAYLRDRERLFPFYLSERFHPTRAEYDAYCRWVADSLPNCHFGHRVDAVGWDQEAELFEIDHTRLTPDGEPAATGRTRARNVVLGIGSVPHVPGPLRPLADSPAVPVHHSADYLPHRERFLTADHVTVVGAGQSGAEVFLDLLRHRPAGLGGLTWIARTDAIAPMEYSKLGLEHFTPDYTRYYHQLPESVRDRLFPQQWQLHKAIDQHTIGAIHDALYQRTLTPHHTEPHWPDITITPGTTVRTGGRIGNDELELHLEHHQQGTSSRLRTHAVVLATGYRGRPLEPLLAPLEPYLRRDSAGRPRIDAQHRVITDPRISGGIYLQNAEHHSHGVGTPDLGLGAWRSAVILNSAYRPDTYRLPRRTAFTTFGLDPARHPGLPVQSHGATAPARPTARPGANQAATAGT